MNSEHQTSLIYRNLISFDQFNDSTEPNICPDASFVIEIASDLLHLAFRQRNQKFFRALDLVSLRLFVKIVKRRKYISISDIIFDSSES